MEAFLRELLPKVLGDVRFEVFAHQGKDELLRKLPGRLAGYSSWSPSTYRVVVVIDEDRQGCVALKAKLEAIVKRAGLSTRSSPGRDGTYQVVTRIAIEELEAWYFGDWAAVRAAYPKVKAGVVRQAGFR